jgi:hypothetical protein
VGSKLCCGDHIQALLLWIKSIEAKIVVSQLGIFTCAVNPENGRVEFEEVWLIQ